MKFVIFRMLTPSLKIRIPKLMNRLIVILILLFGVRVSAISQQKKRINFYELDVIKGKYYQPNTIDPYSGMAVVDFPNGKKRMRIPIKDGLVEGTATEWYDNGQKSYEASYQIGQQEGLEKQWFENGQLKLQIPYVNGLANGECQEYHKDGSLKSEGRFVGGKEEGVHVWYFKNGVKDQEMTYVKGITNGRVFQWYENGKERLKTNHTNGQLDGDYLMKYGNGQDKTKGTYSGGSKVDTFWHWEKDGKLQELEVYDSIGNLHNTFNYRNGSVKTDKGYVEVFNFKDNYFKIEINSDGIVPLNGYHISYSLGNLLLQVIPIRKEASTNSQLIGLDSLILQEQKVIEKKLGKEIDFQSEKGITKQGLNFVYWWFASPDLKEEEKNLRTVLEEHYITIDCKEHMVNLYSVRTVSDKESAVKRMLLNVSDGVQLEDGPIDLNSIVKK